MRRLLNSDLSETDKKKPAKIWSLLESEVDASVKVSFRVHRLEFSHIMQNKDENTQNHIEPDELNERIIEMIKLSTPHDEFRKELQTKNKGFKLAHVLEKTREHKSIIASKGVLQNIGATQDAKVDTIRKTFKKKCFNCNLIHASKACPAFKDKCHICGHVGYWHKCCRKKKFDRNSEHQKKDAVNKIDFRSESEEIIVFQTINESSVKGSNGNAFICLDFKHFRKINRIKTKIDTESVETPTH